MTSFRTLLLAILASNLVPSLLAAPTQIKNLAVKNVRAIQPTLGESVPGTRDVFDIASDPHEVRESRRLVHRRLREENGSIGRMARSNAGPVKDISSRQADDIIIISSTVTTIPKHGSHFHGEIGGVITTTTYIEHYKHGKHRHGKHCPHSHHRHPYNGPCRCKVKCLGDGRNPNKCGSPGGKSSKQPDSTTATSGAPNSTVTSNAPTSTDSISTTTTASTTTSGVSSDTTTTATTTDNISTAIATTTTTGPSIPTDTSTSTTTQPDSVTTSSVTDTTIPSPTPTENQKGDEGPQLFENQTSNNGSSVPPR